MFTTCHAHRGEPGRLGPGREARARDHDHRAAVAHVDALRAAGPHDQRRAATGSTGRRRRRDGRRDRRRTCRRGRWCGRRTGRRPRTSPGGTSRSSEPAAHGPIRRCTPISRIAQTLARYGMACGGRWWLRPCRGRNATRVPPTSPMNEPVGRRAVRRVDRDLLDVVEERVEAGAAEDADGREGRQTLPRGVQIGGRSGSGGGGGGGGGPPPPTGAPDRRRPAA